MSFGAGPAPDYTGAAGQQAASSQNTINQQTQANRPNINTAFGSQSWQQGPDGSWTLNASLNPQLQGAAGNLSQQAASNFSQPFDNGSAARDQAINAAYGQATSRLDPQFNLQQEQLQTQLANQGLSPGSEAYNNAMDQFGRTRNDAYNQAMFGAIGQGTAAQQATFGENMAARNMPLQELSALQGFQSTPQFNAAGAAQAAQYLPASIATGNYNLQNTQLNNQMWGDIMSGVGQLGSSAAGAIALSDERAKHNIRRLPVEAMPGVPVATFEYNHQPGKTHVGVIAQDVERVAPQYVHERPDGLKAVDYSFVPFSFGGK